MKIAYIYIIAILPALFVGCPQGVYAQTEAEEERRSLRGLSGIGFTVNVEQNTAFADSQLVKLTAVKQIALQKLEENNVTVFDDAKVRESIRVPVLYMHVNSLSTRTGIVSFAVTANLYQPVKLILKGDRTSTASTWEDSIVGIASYDNLIVIDQAVEGIVQSFINDYKKANAR